ncbi:hypothetical protein GCM10010095_61580 [Streptomyces anthocyanicus]|nr:hypothetical protein GCM10010095_61580 [Streptomyces anthocyanicus]
MSRGPGCRGSGFQDAYPVGPDLGQHRVRSDSEILGLAYDMRVVTECLRWAGLQDIGVERPN